MSLLIKGGEIVTASEQFIADIYCENETITRIDRKLADVQADEPSQSGALVGFPVRFFFCRGSVAEHGADVACS